MCTVYPHPPRNPGVNVCAGCLRSLTAADPFNWERIIVGTIWPVSGATTVMFMVMVVMLNDSPVVQRLA